MGGLAITPDLALSDLAPTESAMLILPGSELWQDAATDEALASARAFLEAGIPVAAICGATYGLARAGLLDDRTHTSNDPHWLASSGYRGGPRYAEVPAVEDRDVITASVTASLEFARLILARLDVFTSKALDAWYRLYKTGSPACYLEFMEALSHGDER
jgi:putative intracellular protease/amidase